jgi:hypothetical protein
MEEILSKDNESTNRRLSNRNNKKYKKYKQYKFPLIPKISKKEQMRKKEN